MKMIRICFEKEKFSSENNFSCKMTFSENGLSEGDLGLQITFPVEQLDNQT